MQKLFFKTNRIFLISPIIFIILVLIIPGGFIPTELGNTILTIITFLFGIIAGFCIAVTATDYNSIKNVIALETAALASLYENILIYDKEAAEKLSLAIDNYVKRAFDYEIMDYTENTNEDFKKIKEIVRALPIKNELSSIYQLIIQKMNEIVSTRQQLIVLGTKTLSIFQWIVLCFLAIFLILSLYGLRTGEIFFDIVTIVISSVIILLLFLIRDLDLYIWNEKTFGYDVYQNLLIYIGQLPYYPKESIEKGRIRPSEKEYRLGTLINPEKSFERKIEIIKN